MKNFINLKDLTTKDLRRILNDAKKDEKVIESYLGRGSKLKDTN